MIHGRATGFVLTKFSLCYIFIKTFVKEGMFPRSLSVFVTQTSLAQSKQIHNFKALVEALTLCTAAEDLDYLSD